MAPTTLIIAHDTRNVHQALFLIRQLKKAGVPSMHKLGMELHTAAAYEGRLLELRANILPHDLMLDLKPWDVAQTVLRKAQQDLEYFQPAFYTVPLPYNHPSFAAVVKWAAENCHNTIILGITALTSLTEDDISAASRGTFSNGPEAVYYYANLALEAGGTGLVCSPQEAAMVRKHYPQIQAIVTPGVRPAGAAAKGQARVTTPAQAAQAGATHIVVGSPIYNAPDPVAMAQSIVAECTAA